MAAYRIIQDGYLARKERVSIEACDYEAVDPRRILWERGWLIRRREEAAVIGHRLLELGLFLDPLELVHLKEHQVFALLDWIDLAPTRRDDPTDPFVADWFRALPSPLRFTGNTLTSTPDGPIYHVLEFTLPPIEERLLEEPTSVVQHSVSNPSAHNDEAKTLPGGEHLFTDPHPSSTRLPHNDTPNGTVCGTVRQLIGRLTNFCTPSPPLPENPLNDFCAGEPRMAEPRIGESHNGKHHPTGDFDKSRNGSPATYMVAMTDDLSIEITPCQTTRGEWLTTYQAVTPWGWETDDDHAPLPPFPTEQSAMTARLHQLLTHWTSPTHRLTPREDQRTEIIHQLKEATAAVPSLQFAGSPELDEGAFAG